MPVSAMAYFLPMAVWYRLSGQGSCGARFVTGETEWSAMVGAIDCRSLVMLTPLWTGDVGRNGSCL